MYVKQLLVYKIKIEFPLLFRHLCFIIIVLYM